MFTFTAYGTIGYLTKWIEEDCAHPIEEMATGLRNIGGL
ncbi:TetR-like C-terminal domain-containing protein [Solibacillus sp. FSL R7-0682]